MFKLHYNVYEKVEELAKLLAQSSEYTELQAAEDAGERSDHAWQGRLLAALRP